MPKAMMPPPHKGPSLTVVIATPVKGADRKRVPDEEENPDEQEPDSDEDDTQPDTPEEQDNQRIYSEAINALQGKSKYPEEALNEFIETFGRRELDALRSMVSGQEEEAAGDTEHAAVGRLVEGPGRGLEDRIPAAVGDQPVLLSDGEYVIPADVVSMLGDGSTKAGVRVIEAMIDRVRKQKTGSNKQAKALDRESLPA